MRAGSSSDVTLCADIAPQPLAIIFFLAIGAHAFRSIETRGTSTS